MSYFKLFSKSSNALDVGTDVAKFATKTDSLYDLSKLYSGVDSATDLSKLTKNADIAADLSKLDSAGDLFKTDIDDLLKLEKLEDFKGADNISKSLKNGDIPDVNLTSSQKIATKTEFDNMLPTVKSKDDVLNKLKKIPYSKALALGAGASVIAGVAIAAAVKLEEINNTTYTITSISNNNINDETDKSVSIMYTPDSKFTKNDIVTITNSNSDPKIDGTYTPTTTGNGVIVVSSTRLTTPGNSGSLKCSTSFGDQFRTLFNDNVTEPVLGVPADIIKTGGKEANDILSSFGIDFGALKSYWWVSLIVSIICSLVILSVVAVVMLK